VLLSLQQAGQSRLPLRSCLRSPEVGVYKSPKANPGWVRRRLSVPGTHTLPDSEEGRLWGRAAGSQAALLPPPPPPPPPPPGRTGSLGRVSPLVASVGRGGLRRSRAESQRRSARARVLVARHARSLQRAVAKGNCRGDSDRSKARQARLLLAGQSAPPPCGPSGAQATNPDLNRAPARPLSGPSMAGPLTQPHLLTVVAHPSTFLAWSASC
jgi:hypothetical protein